MIPDVVEDIDDNAFYGCKISQIVIPNSIKHIGKNPFVEMDLDEKELVIYCNSPLYCVENKTLFKEKSIISYWGKDTSYEVPYGTIAIEAFAFLGAGLKHIILPSTIVKIDENAFDGDMGLKIMVPDGELMKFMDLLPHSLHNQIMEETDSKDYTLATSEEFANAWTDEYGVMYSNNKERLLKAPNCVTNKDITKHWSFIEFASEFGKVINRQHWTPKDGTPFETLSFRESGDTTKAKYVHFSKQLGELSNKELKDMMDDLQIVELKVKPEVLARRAEENLQLETFILRKKSILNTYSVIEGTKVICDKAFDNFVYLENIELPPTIISIGDKAFCRCQILSSISLPIGLKKLGNKVFYGCKKISSIIIPDGVEVIGNWAFAGCSSLTEFYMPSSIKEIGRDIFQYCKNDLRIYIPHGELKRFKGLLPNYADKLFEQGIDDDLQTTQKDEKLELIENFLLPDGSIYNGEGKVKFSSLELRGQGEILFTNGDTYNGTFKYGRPLGWGKYTFKNGHTHRGYFDSYPKGIGYLNENYGMCVGNFNYGKLHGWGICYRNNIFKFGYWEKGKLVKDETRRTLIIRYEITNGRFGYRGNLVQIGKEHDFIRYGIPEKLLASPDEFPISLIPKLPAMGFEFLIDGTVKMGWINDHSSGDYVLYKPDGIIEMGKWNENIKTSDVSSFKTLPAKNEYVIDGIEVYKNT